MKTAVQPSWPDEFPTLFDPANYNGLSVPIDSVLQAGVASLIGDEIFVQDLRTDFAVVPKCNTIADAKQYFGVVERFELGWLDTPAGKACWRLVGYYIRSGAATFIPKFIKENGQPADQVLVVHSWGSAPGLPSDLEVSRPGKQNWLSLLFGQKIGVAGFTNANGDVGFGYGSGMIGGPNGGPGVIFPLVPTHIDYPWASDCSTKLGWIGGTDHTTINPIFQIVTKTGGGPSPIPPPGPVANALVDIVNGQIVKYLLWQQGAPPVNQNALGLTDAEGNVIAHILWLSGPPVESQ